MLKEEIDKLVSLGEFPEISRQKKLVETHISWVILCDDFVYKIKKPVKYSFLNFSTIALRKNFCEREVYLNRRFSKNIYLKVVPVRESNGLYSLGQDNGRLIDYAVKMRKLDPEKQMDFLLKKNKVRPVDIQNLAKQIADFHKFAKVIYAKNVFDLQIKFNDLKAEKEFLCENIGPRIATLIDLAIEESDNFLERSYKLLHERLNSGFFRDCHGDLHTRNIFLLPTPQLFDCIEFNDEYRKIDVLNEVAFLCMDLDALKRKDLSNHFIKEYNLQFPVIKNREDLGLFIYYKSYRANVRAKVNCLQASGIADEEVKFRTIREAEKYLKLMESYIRDLDFRFAHN